MSFIAEARVPTTSGRRYVGQLLKHWAHSLAVIETDKGGMVTFPRDARGADWSADALVSFRCDDDAILCRIEASAEGQLQGLKEAVARHLDRFAFREAPLPFGWQEQP